MKQPYSEAHSRLSRRTVFAGAGAVGAAVVATGERHVVDEEAGRCPIRG